MRDWQQILVGFDERASGADALVLGELLARTSRAELLVAHVAPEDDEARRALVAAAEKRLAGSDASWRFELARDRSAARALVELVRSHPGVGALVVGSSHRGGAGRVLPGGVGQHLLSSAPCAVAVASAGLADVAAQRDPQTGLAERLRVLAVGYDASAESEAALTIAAELAAAADATLRVIAVGHAPSAGAPAGPGEMAAPSFDLQAALHDRVAALPDRLRALPIFERGEAAVRLLERAEEGVDLLLVGSRGHGPIGSVLLGSTSSVLIRSAPCPVVVAPRPALAAGD